MVKIFLTETPARTVIIAGNFVSNIYRVFKLPQQIVGDHKSKEDPDVTISLFIQQMQN